jgi:LmbE family N-acetylglucosaminyl deacetylase
MVYQEELMLKTILVVSPHPDDETLGCGGSLLKWKAQGHELHWLNITNMKVEYGFTKEEMLDRAEQIKRVAREYRFDGVYDLGLKPAWLDQYPKTDLVEKMRFVIEKVRPHTIVLPYKYDAHSDHTVTTELVCACTKVFRASYVKQVMMMEINSETDFVIGDAPFYPNYFVDISPHLDKKIEILKIYHTEVGTFPFPRSAEAVKAQAMIRGVQAGCQYAEGFMILKMID